MPPSDFANADLDKIVESLTTEEATLLTGGVGFWRTHQIDRLGIPSVKVSDGPNGIRGNHFFMGTPAKCLPSSTALGATWDRELVEEVGLRLLAGEAKLRAASIILAPTVNIQRNPLGGRSFESFSEDPFLSGILAASYVNGTQKGGIGTTIKHFVANDKEDDRFGYNSVVSQRALREIYLMPFMLAQKYAQPWAYMTAYNRLNGTHCSENPTLLKSILREEWGFNGLVMSDWFGTYSIDLSLKAGLDLEMPGVNKWRTPEYVNRNLAARKITVPLIKERARKVLELVQKCAKGAPEILDGDGIERTVESDEDKALLRRVAAESIVLLRNETNILPLNLKEVKKLAIIGPNAKALVLSGGGSAALKASYFVSPYNGIVNAVKESNENVEISYSEGARAFLTMPSLDYDIFTESGERGWTGSWHAHENDDSLVPLETAYAERFIDETRIFISDSAPKGITKRWTLKLRGQLKPREQDCLFEFGLTVSGRAKLFVDGKLVIDNATRQRRGEAFFGCGTREERGTFSAKAGVKHNIYVEFCNVRAPADGDEDEALMDANAGVLLGGAVVEDSDALLAQAVEIAKNADTAIVVVGLNADWETEGNDRTTLALPGRTDELVRKIWQANPRTIVVNQSGSAVLMPWADSVPAVVQAWYLGNATGDAIADVLFGKVNPSGKLSLTFPKRYEDVPSAYSFTSENGKIHYTEDLFVGYKHYQQRQIKPQFAFGHGLSYTTFSLDNPTISDLAVSNGELDLKVSVSVTNTGSAEGSAVIQVYVRIPNSTEAAHPPRQLKGFAKVRNLAPGASTVVEIVLDKYAVSYWNDVHDHWSADKGVYEVFIGTSSDDTLPPQRFTLPESFCWRGL